MTLRIMLELLDMIFNLIRERLCDIPDDMENMVKKTRCRKAYLALSECMRHIRWMRGEEEDVTSDSKRTQREDQRP